MKKIIVEKNEGIAEVIDRILSEPGEELSLVIPKGSALGRSVSNFHLLKREADSAGRHVVIESVDDTILSFAKDSGLESSHPLWKGVRGSGGFSDIVPRSAETGSEADEPHGAGKKKSSAGASASAAKRGKKIEPEPEPTFHDADEEKDVEIQEALEGEDEETDKKTTATENRFFGGSPKDMEDDDDDDAPRERRRVPRSLIIAIIAIIIIVIGAVYVTSAFFDRADVTINFKQAAYSYQSSMTADKNAVGIDPTSNTIPAQIFNASKNLTQTYVGSVVKDVSQKAQGTITIYNAYGSSPQTLVATTRFVTPDGKVFRLVNNVTVPGESNDAGKLTPSSITAPIVADQPGPDYNVGPVARLSVPGFEKDSARYAGFYGAITSPTTGGFIGQRATPTATDIANAKASTTLLLQATLTGGFSGNYPNNFKILDGATTVQVTKLTVNTSTDANGNYTVFGEATLQAIGFDESALKNYLLTLAQAEQASSTFSSLTLNYSDVSANFTKGQVAFTLSAQGSLEPAFSPDDFTAQILGKSISDARNAISSLPDLADGQISVWPSWLWSIPSDPKKVHISVN